MTGRWEAEEENKRSFLDMAVGRDGERRSGQEGVGWWTPSCGRPEGGGGSDGSGEVFAGADWGIEQGRRGLSRGPETGHRRAGVQSRGLG